MPGMPIPDISMPVPTAGRSNAALPDTSWAPVATTPPASSSAAAVPTSSRLVIVRIAPRPPMKDYNGTTIQL
jgi:hypothetical protein